ncbi:restriction endonuclease subunit S [Pleomorphomonas sp. JP5]|uniref:restriction endonuclease subunit S n=1 Tax=Pleomorphomonas sp. JP5 TaxID=2942998 RepID=UPI002044B435|nr:restriction endonuclease subunit S [Pleomorphomonas sp. JP5]MCM5557501.1 restriction endonuclease subunit S [Pleomorphomonas sp. JP5]
MTQALIDNLPLIAAAPDGIKALRGLILDLAVRGKLVPQDPKDEPASELLKRIEDERRRLIEAGSIRKGPSRPSRPVAEIETPQGWSSASLGDIIGSIDAGWSPACLAEPSPSEATWGVLKTTAVQSLNYLQAENKQLPSSLRARPELEVRSGDILITRAGPKNRVGVSCLVQHTRPKLMISDKIIRIHVVGDIIDSGFVCLAMNAGVTAEFLEAAKSGMAESQMNISQEKLRVAPLAIPPLAEQRRIVAKVDELMALCDWLEAQQADAETVHAALVKTLLDTLIQSQDADDFAANWQRLSQHFPTIFTTEASVDALRQTIVQLAVLGKLTSQYSSDTPAGELMSRVLSMGNPSRNSGRSAEAYPPYHLPGGWEWVSLGQLGPEFQNGVSSRGDIGGRPVTVLRLADVEDTRISLSDSRELNIDRKSILKYGLKFGDILIVRVNGSSDIVGKFVLVDDPGDSIYCDHFIRMRLSSEIIDPFYLEVYSQSQIMRERIRKLFITTAGQKTVNQSHICSLPIPLPPLAEQHRIVAKVDELFALCDSLKAQIAESRAVQRQLATALVEQALAA